MTRFLRRVRFFLSIVWRHATGPSRDEPAMNPLRCWWEHALDVRTAWEVAGIFHGADEGRHWR